MLRQWDHRGAFLGKHKYGKHHVVEVTANFLSGLEQGIVGSAPRTSAHARTFALAHGATAAVKVCRPFVMQ